MPWPGVRRWVETGNLRESLSYSWLILSLPLLAAVVLPLAAPASTIQAIAPHCVWKTQFGHECPACGLTTAFLHIGRGEWRAATASNAAGIPVYAAFLFNSILWMRSLVRAARSRWMPIHFADGLRVIGAGRTVPPDAVNVRTETARGHLPQTDFPQ
jgi:hypothetical protein